MMDGKKLNLNVAEDHAARPFMITQGRPDLEHEVSGRRKGARI